MVVSFIQDPEVTACLDGIETNRREGEDLNLRAGVMLDAAIRCERRARSFELSLETFLRLKCNPKEQSVVVAAGRAMLVDPSRPGSQMIVESQPLELDENGNVDLDELFCCLRAAQ